MKEINLIRKFKNFLYINYGIERTLPHNQFENLRNKLILDSKIEVVLDVGASIGSWTREIRKFHPNLDIMCFEPLEPPYNALKERFKNDPRIKTFNFALGSSNSYREMYLASNNGESSSFYQPDRHLESLPSIKFNNRTQVKVFRLDSIDGLKNIKSLYLKMDVQEAEWEVFLGLGILTKNVNLIELEVNFNSLYNNNMHPLQTLVNLLSQGFEYYTSTKPRIISTGQHLYCNVLLSRKKNIGSNPP
jgi:FkbM family methyltransferase